MKKALSLFILMLAYFSIYAQNQSVTMADKMRSNGKIYVVVAVILTIFAGLIIYLVRLDRKISRLEKQS
jgi:hypothetical protein